MAGHSHWAGIKHKKALIDNKRGKLWSKLSKAIIVAAKMGGGDPDTNLRLRYAIDDAKSVSMPKENIVRAVKRGTGELEGGNLEEALYEGYGPGGVAVLCEILTDNRPNALVIPPQALAIERGREVCYVAGPDGPRRREVAIGRFSPEMLEVESGLAEGEEVLLDPYELERLGAGEGAGEEVPSIGSITAL